MYYLEASNKCFNSQKVEYVVSIDNAIAVTRGIIQLAKSKKIPTLIIQNGIIYEKIFDLKFEVKNKSPSEIVDDILLRISAEN